MSVRTDQCSGRQLQSYSQAVASSVAGYDGAPPLVPGLSEDKQDSRSTSVEYWRLFVHRKGTIISMALAGLLLGTFVAKMRSPVYQAHVSLEIQDINREFMNTKQVDPNSVASDLPTHMAILQTASMLQRTILKLKKLPPTDPVPEAPLAAVWRAARKEPTPTLAAARDRLLENTARDVIVRTAADTRIIEIVADCPDPVLAAAFVNTMAADYIEYNLEARWEMSRRTSDWLAGQLQEMRIKLEGSENALREYARNSRLIYTSDRQNVSEENLRQLQAELSKASADRVVKQSKYEVGRTASLATLREGFDDGNLRAIQTNLSGLQRQEAELSAVFKPEYSKAKRVRAQIVELESALGRERRAILERIENDFHEAERRESLLASAYREQTNLVTEDSGKSIRYNILRRDVDTNRNLYEMILQRVKEASIASAMKASNIHVVDPATVPRQPRSPSPAANAVLGLSAGLIIGMALAAIRPRRDETLRAPGDAAYVLGLSELGVIPRASVPSQLRAYLGSAAAQVPNGVSKSKPTPLSDSFRSVLASILFAGENGSQPRVLVVTSAAAAEGKTTVASNLAMAVAKGDRTVLLIDGDLRKPRLHEIFGLDNSRGLTEPLEERCFDDIHVRTLVRTTSIPNLYVLTAGQPLPGVPDALFSLTMPDVVAHCRERFDMVIIDTPPMLLMPDARVLGRMADGVVLVVRSSRTTRDRALAACYRLSEDKINVLGVILNDWNPKSASNVAHGYQDSTDDRAYYE